MSQRYNGLCRGCSRPIHGGACPSATDQLFTLLDEIGAKVTFSANCRSGIVGDLCRCWRCRGEEFPQVAETAAARDADLIDRAKAWRLSMPDPLRALFSDPTMAEGLVVLVGLAGLGCQDDCEAPQHRADDPDLHGPGCFTVRLRAAAGGGA